MHRTFRIADFLLTLLLATFTSCVVVLVLGMIVMLATGGPEHLKTWLVHIQTEGTSDLPTWRRQWTWFALLRPWLLLCVITMLVWRTRSALRTRARRRLLTADL